MSETQTSEKSSKPNHYSSNSNSQYSQKEYSSHSNSRGGKRYYDNQKPGTRSNETYQENRGSNTRKNHYYDEEGQSNHEVEYSQRKDYNSKNDGVPYNKQHSGGTYNKGPKRTGQYPQANLWKKKKENFKKITKPEVLEKHEQSSPPSQTLLEIIENNPQLFSREPQLPVNFEKFDFDLDDCFSPRPPPTNQTEQKGPNDQPKEHRDQRDNRNPSSATYTKKLVEWDDDVESDPFKEIDIKKMDQLLRGNSKTETKEIGYQKEQPKESLEEKEDVQDPWDLPSEENGEFSNIDALFEKKLKENLVQFKEDDDDYDFGVIDKNIALQDEDDEAPVWEEYNAADIHKETKDVEGLFMNSLSTGFGNGSRSLQSNINSIIGDPFGRELSSNFQQDSYFKSDGDALLSGFSFKDQLDDRDDGDSILHSFKSNFNPKEYIDSPDLYLNTQQHHQPQSQQAFQPLSPGPINNPLIDINAAMYGNPMAYQGQNPVQQTQPPVGLFPVQMFNPDVFKFFAKNDYEHKAWYYMDLHGLRQGPFSGKEMDEWYKGRHLPMELLVTYGENANFRPLRELVDYVLKSTPGYEMVMQHNYIHPPPQLQPQVQQPLLQAQLQAQLQAVVQPQAPQRENDAPSDRVNGSQFQFSDLLSNPNLRDIPIIPEIAKDVDETDQQDAYTPTHQQYKQGGKKQSGGQQDYSKRNYGGGNQQYNSNRAGYSPANQYTSPIGMLQPGMAFPVDFANPNYQGGNQGPKNRTNSGGYKVQANSGKNTNRKNKQGGGETSATADMTNQLKSMLGLGGIMGGIADGNSTAGAAATGQSTTENAGRKKKENVVAFDASDFPSLNESNK